MAQQIRKSIAAFLLIRESEIKLVSRLFAFEFFKGAAIAIFFTASISLFLKNQPISDLPKVFVLSALLLWITGFIYHKLEHHFSVRKIILIILLFNSACFIIFRLLMPLKGESFFLYTLFSFYNVFYLLNNLEFWGTVALLFDVRQSKRLFSIVSAGDIPAKMIGYTAAILLVPFIGTENLLLLALVFFMVSLFLYGPLVRLPEMKNLEHAHHQTTQSIRSIQNAITGNNLIRHLAFVSFFSVASYIVVNFIFYGYVKNNFKTDQQLAGFFAIFLIAIRGVTLLVKLIITNRVVDKIGLRWSLLITPVVMFILSTATVIYLTEFSQRGASYLFGSMAIIYEVLRSAFLTPVALAALQPLPTHQRLRGHTIIKGLMDPFGFLIMGIVLWLMHNPSGEFNFKLVGYILMGLVACWIYFAYSVDKRYINSLMSVLQKRTVTERDISITDTQSLEFLLEKFIKADETMALSILQMVSNQPVEKDEFIKQALMHPSEQVKLAALKQINTVNGQKLLPVLKELLNQESSVSVLRESILKLSELDPEYDFSKFLAHQDKEIVKTCLEVYIQGQQIKFKKEAINKLNDWFQSPDPQDQIHALQVATKDKSGYFIKQITDLMQHHFTDVKNAAYTAAGKSGHLTLVQFLLKEFIKHQEDSIILINALGLAEENSLPLIKEFLFEQQCEGIKSQKLIMLVGRLPGEAPFHLLEDCLLQFPEKAGDILPAMLRSEIKTRGNDQPYKKTLREKLQAAGQIIFFIDFLNRAGHKNEIVIKALELELHGIRNNCLDLFSFLYDMGKIKKAKTGFDIKSHAAIANSLEMIHITVAKEFSELFNLLFEDNSIREKAGALRKRLDEKVLDLETIVKDILSDEHHYYNSWTKSCALYLLKDTQTHIDQEIVLPFTNSNQPVLKNMAEYIISENI